jgi:tetratricopeptide (TPR) repeat protein
MLAPAIQSPIWKVPYRRNPFFTGSEEVLSQLQQALQQENAAALSQPQGISGLGGIGKTQVALEYAYRHQRDYQAILWVGADSASTLTSEFVNIAHVLGLPERSEQDQQVIVKAVMHWLQQHVGWLLILDNVDNLAGAEPFLPKAGQGHTLLTTRAWALSGVAQRVELQKMEPEMGAMLLLRRAHLLPVTASLNVVSADKRKIACEISQTLDGLPLALDQSGAYIKETSCTLEKYMELYQTRRQELLHARGSFEEDYSASVATTWSLSFEKVSKTNPSASDLLDFCSFLHPDAIPEEIITAGAEHLTPQLQAIVHDDLQFHASIAALLAYSLIHRNADDHMLNMHRLVQAVLKDSMNDEKRQEWVDRTVRAVEEAFPPLIEFKTWSQCDRCLPHAQVCVERIEQEGMISPEAVHLLNQTGYYLYKRGRYQEVEPLFERLSTMLYQPDSMDHNTAVSLNNLALLYYQQGQYEKAEQLLQRALVMEKHASGQEHPAVANVLNSLAGLYYTQGRFAEAEPLYQQALTILEQKLGLQHPATAQSIHNLAALYRTQGKYIQAEPLLKQALELCEQVLESRHPDIASSLLNLAELYYEQGRFDEAEPLYQQALEICKHSLGSQHPTTAISLSSLAKLYSAQRKYDEAESLYQRALTIQEKQLGAEHPLRAFMLHNLAALYQGQGRLAEAEPLYLQALAIRKQTLGSQHPDIAKTLYNLAIIYKKQGRFTEAESLYQQALSIYEQQLGPDHSLTKRARESYAQLLRSRRQGRGDAKFEM